MKRRIVKSALHISGIYLGIATAWILLSDRLASALSGTYAQLAVFQTWKGIFFVAATGLLLFFYSFNRMTKLIAVQLERENLARQAYDERGVLLREVHHRVKNNMQLIISLLNIKRDSPDSIDDARTKISSMAYVHELLYRSPDMAAIRTTDFCTGMARLIAEQYGEHALSVNGRGDDCTITANLAIPLGIFISEASTNAIQHARSDSAATLHVDIEIRQQDEQLVVQIRDDGVGFADNPVDANGTAIMTAIAQQVGGQFRRYNENGALVRLVCPLTKNPAIL